MAGVKHFEIQEQQLAAKLPGGLHLRKGTHIGPEEHNVQLHDVVLYDVVTADRKPVADGAQYSGRVMDPPFTLPFDALATRADLITRMHYANFDDMKKHLEHAYKEKLDGQMMTLFEVSKLTRFDDSETRTYTPG